MNKGKKPTYEQLKVQDHLMISASKKSVTGFLSVDAYSYKKGKKVHEGHKDLGENLATNNSKWIMTHLIAQSPSSVSGIMNNVNAFDPRVWASDVGGLAGGKTVDGSTFNPSAEQLQLARMAFGTNQKADNTVGASPAIDQYGLFNAVSKGGYPAQGMDDSTVANYFYGEGTTVHQYLRTTGTEVDDGILRVIVRMATTEGQQGDGSIVYREAGLFTTLFYASTNTNGGTQDTGFMFARKTFSDITKTNDLELEFVWEIRF